MVVIIYKNKILIIKCLNNQKVVDFFKLLFSFIWFLYVCYKIKKKKKKLFLISIGFNL